MLLSDLSVSPGDRVALWSENAPLWPVVYLGATTFPAVIVPVLPDFPARDVDTIVDHAEAKVLFVSARLKARLTDNATGRALLERLTVRPRPAKWLLALSTKDCTRIMSSFRNTGMSSSIRDVRLREEEGSRRNRRHPTID